MQQWEKAMGQIPKLLIHIGYHKTGSTWLQQVLFKDEKAGFLTPWGSQSSQAVIQFLVPNAYRFSPESAKKTFEVGFQEAQKRGLVPVLSHEALSDNFVSGTYQGKEVADRIHAVFPDSRILIIIREQQSMILSSYRQYIKQGGIETIQQYIGADINKPAFKPTCRLDYLEYDLPITYYQNLFGAANILVLPLELLSRDKKSFVQKIINFAGIDINAGDIPDIFSRPKNIGYKGGAVAVRRRLNFFLDKPTYARRQGKSSLADHTTAKLSVVVERLLPQGIHQRVEDDWEQFIAEYVGDRFKDSNQRTSHLIGMDLADFGYPC
ncbi:MAG: sulfotransferase [Coleofasciculus sp. D1-CHI-01]|uniref:sulfotransferase n=1 Tax=Coleofasciculus sp. D1-CHI-01 TaxID=3068482 RepID=UPI0032F65F0B